MNVGLVGVEDGILTKRDGPYTCIYANEDRGESSWIMWVYSDGTGILYLERDPDGGVVGEGIELPPTRVKYHTKNKRKRVIKLQLIRGGK